MDTEVQVHEQSLVEVQVQAEGEAGVLGVMEAEVEGEIGVQGDDVEAEEDDDDSSE